MILVQKTQAAEISLDRGEKKLFKASRNGFLVYIGWIFGLFNNQLWSKASMKRTCQFIRLQASILGYSHSYTD